MTMTQEERISRLEGAYDAISVIVTNMVTKDELRSTAEMLRAENQASENRLRAEMRAAELRIIRWMVGTVFAASALVLAVMKLWQ